MEAMELYGVALQDYFNGNKTAQLTIIRKDGHRAIVPISVFFRNATELEIDKIALNLCQGKILDVGAGTGEHALYLQKQGYDVTVLDISEGACEVMYSRGIKKIICMNIWKYHPKEKFDTLLILGRSIGLVRNLNGFEKILEKVNTMMSPNGQILLNSIDVRFTDEKDSLNYLKENIKDGRYFGEIKMRFECAGKVSEFTNYLHIDSETLSKIAEQKNWKTDLLYTDEEGNYLAKLNMNKF